MPNSKDFQCGIIIKKYDGSDDVVEIPEEINGIPVTEIGKYAFNEYQLNLFEEPRNLKEIYIPNSVTYIGEYAFSHCNNLTKITIASEHSIYIAENAFKDCDNLTEIIITANHPIEIDFDVFKNCYSIERIYINTSAWSYASVKETFGKNPQVEILPLE